MISSGLEIAVALRRVAGQAMEIRERDYALAGRPGHMNPGLEGGQRHAHVGGMHRDAGLAGAEDGMHAVDAGNRGAAAAGLAFVAGRRGVVEIIAARPLQQIAAGRRHIAQLRRRAGEDRARQQRITLLDRRMPGEIGIRHQRADAQAAVPGFFHCLEWQSRDVDQPRRTFNILLHQVEQVGAAGDELCRRIGCDLRTASDTSLARAY